MQCSIRLCFSYQEWYGYAVHWSSLRVCTAQYYVAVCRVIIGSNAGNPFWKTFTKELAGFLNELLRSIEVDVRLDAQLFSKIREMIEGLISLHIASLDNQLRNLKKLPESSRVNTMHFITPVLVTAPSIMAQPCQVTNHIKNIMQCYSYNPRLFGMLPFKTWKLW